MWGQGPLCQGSSTGTLSTMSLRARERLPLPHARRAALASALAFAATTLVVAPAWADTTDNDGFEAFSLGDPVGQMGWTAQDVGGYNAAHFDLGIVDPTAVWPGGELGARALRISNGVTSGGFGNQLQTPSLLDEAGEASAESLGLSGGSRQSRLSGSFTFASATRTYQAGLGVSLSPDRGDGARMSWFRVTDQPSGLQVEVGYYDVTVHDFGYEVVASGLSRDEVHTLDFTLDLVDGPDNDVLWVSVGGECGSWATSGSWEDYHRDYSIGNPTKTVDSLLIRVGGAAVPSVTGGGLLFDDVSLTSSTVAPLPPIGIPTAPVAPTAHVNFTSVAVTGTPVATNPCAPVTEYAVSAWPLGGGAPRVFTSPTPTFTFATPFQGAFTLTMGAVNSEGTSPQAAVALTFDPVFSGDDGDDDPDPDPGTGSGGTGGGTPGPVVIADPAPIAAAPTAPSASTTVVRGRLASTGADGSHVGTWAAVLVAAGATALVIRRARTTSRRSR